MFFGVVGCRHGSLVVIEGELGVDGEAASPWEFQYDVWAPALGEGDLEVEVAVLAQAGDFKQVLQRELGGISSMRGVCEDCAEVLDVFQDLGLVGVTPGDQHDGRADDDADK